MTKCSSDVESDSSESEWEFDDNGNVFDFIEAQEFLALYDCIIA